MRSWRNGLYLVRRFGAAVVGLDPVPGPSFYRPGPGFRGINVVCDGDESLANVPGPGGLPGAEPLTPFPCPAIAMGVPYERVSEAKPATCDEHGAPLPPERGFHEMRITLDRHLPKDAIVVIGPDHQSVLVRWPDRDE